MPIKPWTLLSASSAVVLAASAAPLAAQQQAAAPAGDSHDIVVTAQRFSTTVQSTPLSIAAISGKDLAVRGVTQISQLTGQVPSLATRDGGPAQTQFSIRGISSGGGIASTVGFYFDEYTVLSPSGATAGKTAIDPNLYDLARVEILRGPQGTLYGASSLGGTIRLIPAAPEASRFDASAQLIGSSTRHGGLNGTANAMVNIPIVDDKVALRIVGTRDHQSGYIDRIVVSPFPLPDTRSTDGDIQSAPRGDVADAPVRARHKDVNDADVYTIRAALLLKPTDDLRITPGIFYQRIKLGGEDSLDLYPGTLAHYQPFDVAEPLHDRFYIASLKADWNLGAVNILSASAYSNRKTSSTEDSAEQTFKAFGAGLGLTGYDVGDGGVGGGYVTENAPVKQFTQELRVSGTMDRLRWLIGGYYSNYRSAYAAETVFAAAPAVLGDNIYTATEKTKIIQYAAFVNLSYDLTSRLRASAGVRYFRTRNTDAQSSTGLFGSGDTPPTAARFKGFNPAFNLAYTLSDHHLLYATASKGFRDGGADAPLPSACNQDLQNLGYDGPPRAFKPDTVWNFEGGSKNRFFDDRLTINADGYYIKWRNVQQYIQLPICGFAFNGNAANASVSGAELEMEVRVTGAVTLQQTVGYTHARYDDSNPNARIAKGDRLLNVPDWTTSTAVLLDTRLSDEYSLFGRGAVTYVSRENARFDTTKRVPGYALLDGRIGVRRGQISLALFGENLTDKRAILDYRISQTTSVPGLDRVSIARPRTIGVDLSYNLWGGNRQ